MAEEKKPTPFMPWIRKSKERLNWDKLIDKPETSYNKEAVDKSIESSNRAGKKIGLSESKAIHSLLKGRHAKGGKIKTAQQNPKHKKCW